MKFVFPTIGSLGDLHPTLGIALELKRRNHQVTVLAAEFYRERIESTGLGYEPMRPHLRLDDKQLIADIVDKRRGGENLHKKYLFPAVEDSFDDCLTACRGADLICGSLACYFLPTLSHKVQVPWVMLMLQPMALWSVHPPPVLAPIPALGRMRWLPAFVHRLLLNGLLRISNSWAGPVQALREKHGLPRSHHFFPEQHISPGRLLCLWSKEFADQAIDWPPQARLTGFVNYDHSELSSFDESLEEFKQRHKGKSLVVFTLGSTVVENADDEVRLFLDVSKKLELPAIITVNKELFNQHQQEQTSDLKLITYVPYSQLFQNVQIIVQPGGVGTTAQAMQSGALQLILPNTNDQFDNAFRIKDAGLGDVLPAARMTAKRLLAKIQGLLADSSGQSLAQEVAQRIRLENGCSEAADQLESYAQSQKQEN